MLYNRVGEIMYHLVIAKDKECKKYKSVNIANSHEEFIRKIPQVIKLSSDKQYCDLLLKEAKENTWVQKANAIIQLLSK